MGTEGRTTVRNARREEDTAIAVHCIRREPTERGGAKDEGEPEAEDATAGDGCVPLDDLLHGIFDAAMRHSSWRPSKAAAVVADIGNRVVKVKLGWDNKVGDRWVKKRFLIPLSPRISPVPAPVCGSLSQGLPLTLAVHPQIKALPPA